MYICLCVMVRVILVKLDELLCLIKKKLHLSPAHVKFYYEYLFEVWSIVLNKNLIEQLEVF